MLCSRDISTLTSEADRLIAVRMKGSIPSSMPPKVSMRSQQSGDQKIPMPSKDSGAANTALSAAGMSSRVSRRVDVSPEHLQPLPDDVEVSPASNSFILG